jgi:MFS family permease
MATANAATITCGIFLNPLLEEFGWTRAATSGGYSLYIWLMTFFGIAAGWLTDRFGPRPVLTASGLILGVGFFLMSRINGIWHLYLIYGVLMAMAMGAEWIPLLSTVPRWFTRRRALMQGIMFSGSGFGMIVWPLIANHFISSYGWRNAYVILGAITGVLITVAAQFMRRAPEQIEEPVNEGAGESPAFAGETSLPLRRAVRRRDFWVLCAVYGCLWFCSNVVMVHIVIHSIGIGITAARAASIPATIGAVGIGSRILMGGLGDRIGYKKALVIGFALLVAVFLWLSVAKELWALYLFAVVFSLGHSGAVLQSPLTARLFSLAWLGAVVGGVECISTAFGTTSPVLAGRIFDITGSYQLAFLICAGVALAGLMFTLLLRVRSEASDSYQDT